MITAPPPPSTMELLERPQPAPMVAFAVVPRAPVRIAPLLPACRALSVSGVLAVNPADGSVTVPPGGLWLDPRALGPYLAGHNPGAGAFIMGLRAGDCLRYQGHLYRVTAVATIAGNLLWPMQAGAPLTLQTCVTLSGSLLRIVQAVPNG